MLQKDAVVDFYVKPTRPANATCPGQPCYTLDQYAQNLSLFQNHTNISLLFLSGEHTLIHTLNFTGTDTHVVKTLTLSNTVDNKNVIVNLEAGIYVRNVSTVGVYNISMTSKGSQVFLLMDVETITQYQVEMENVEVRIENNLTPTQSTKITKCCYRSSNLEFVHWGYNDQTTVQIQSSKISRLESNFSRDGLLFSCPFSVQNRLSLTLDIQDSVIEGWESGINISCPALTASSLSIQRTNITDNGHGVNVVNESSTVDNCVIKNTGFVDNKESGITLYNSMTMNFTIQDTYFENNGKMTLEPIVFGGLLIYSNSVNNLTIKGANFTNNHPYAILLANSATELNVVIKNTTIRGSQFGINIKYFVLANILIQDTSTTESDIGIVILLEEHANKVSGNTISCENCTIASNNVAGITLINIQDKVIVSNSKFHDNRATPIIAYGSQLELSGETNFENNTAVRGGGLSLIYSNVYFANNSNITFRNNSAEEFGGAIHVVSKRYAAQTLFRDWTVISEDRNIGVIEEIPCFFQFNVSTHEEFETLRIQVHFINNTAMLGGEAIYGAPLNNTCTNLDGLFLIGETQKIFVFKETVNKISPIASDPTRVCFCDDNGRPQCKNTTIVHNEVLFPGEIFNVSLVLVGYNFGTVTGSIYANVLRTGSYHHLGQNQHTQAANFSSCNNLIYSVHSNDSSEVIKLTASEQKSSKDEIERNEEAALCKTTNPKPCTALLTTPIYINITLEDCPLGFKLDENGLMCECDDNLNENRHNVTCEIRDHKGYINREGTVWVGVNQNENDTNNTYYLTSDYCPHSYCKHEKIAVDLTDPDSQCSQNHSGNLCGRCKDGYSLQLGSDRCLDCPNNDGLALLIFFAVAGFLLVFFIKFLDLTVAHGTINGLILYANIVWSYNGILFPVQNHSAGYNILRVPIAWLNLDFGIETCFFEGMDAYTKTWLQFVFPLYIWSIAGLIILVCHYSTRATRLFGNNSVPVLATLFLLAYGKLIRTITNIFTYAELKYSHHDEALNVWSVDGTMEYGELKHVVLCIVGLACSIFLWLPYTLTLLLVPCLKRWGHLKPLCWINKPKPFYDAYYGPFKDAVIADYVYCRVKHHIRYQSWIGALLIVRGMMFVVFTTTSTSNPNANILFLVVIATVLLMYSAMVGLLYKKWYVSLLENLYILNLLILGGGFLFTQINSQANLNREENDVNPVVIVSISTALIQFVGIVVFHFVYKCVPKKLEQNKNEKKTPPLREPLLEQDTMIIYRC